MQLPIPRQIARQHLAQDTRRHFFSRCGVGVGSMALSSLMQRDSAAALPAMQNPLAPRQPHGTAKAKSIIYLFMAGGPSQLEMWDYKPKLAELSGKPIPESYIKGKRFAFMNSSHRTTLLGPKRKFAQQGQNGTWVSDLLPYTGSIVDELSIIKTCQTELFNHAPAKLFMNAGTGTVRAT